jgi:uncharacterized repeat protein (TIGR01451 family)
MKKFLLSLATLLFFMSETNAQLTANAGVDFSYCANQTASAWTGFATATGGTPPYTYAWSPASALSDSTLEHPVPTATVTTTYTVVVTDNLGATATDTVIATVNPVPAITVSANDSAVCAGDIVAYTATVTGGLPPYTYIFDFGDGASVFFANPTHAYGAQNYYTVNVQVTDANQCSNATYMYESVSQMDVVALFSPIACFGANNGSMNAQVTGGIAPVFFNWSNGQNTQVINNLVAGIYTVTVTDRNQCTATAFNNLTEPALLTVFALNAVNASAAGVCDGSFDLLTSGGTPPYTYVWNTGNTTAAIINLCPATYNVTVADANGCTSIIMWDIVVDSACNGSTLAASISSLHGDISCAHPVDTLTLNVTGGVPPYTYFWWSNPQDTSQQLIVNQSAVYYGGVTDANGCQRLAADTISNSGIMISLTGITDANCNGSSNGSIYVTVTNGTPPYTYLWSNNATTDSLVNVAPGTYVLAVTDAASCIAMNQFTIGQTSTDWSYYVYTGSTDANCGNTGTATANIYGGTPPFTYLWSYNNETAQTITGLAPGTYTVTVTGANGCTRVGAVYVTTTCYNVITGYAFNDANGNCIKDGSETTVGGMYVTAQSAGNTFYGYSDNTGYYSIQVPAQGAFSVSLSPAGWGWGNCPAVSSCPAQTVTFGSLGDSTAVNFGLSPSSGFNLSLHPGWSSANPGFQKDYWVLYSQSSIPLYTGPAVITFTYDSVLVYLSCTNGGIHNVTNHTVTWNLATVPQQWVDWALRPMAYFTVPANTPIGYQLTQDFLISPTSGDCDSSDNHLVVTEPVTGSMDPNEKQVSPAGDIQEQDSVLTYTIHFQNTGNDTTYFVILKDTLSPHLEPASVNNLSSSHAYTSFNVSENGILTWLFNPIFLVDSATNEPASKGFVMFKVKKKAGLSLNTEIKNTAHIYFDYNEPVVTNTVSSKLTDPTYIHNITNDAAIQVTAAPNPFTLQTQLTVEGISGAYNFELFDVSGKLLQKKNGLTDSRFAINREGMSAGVYFYSITTSTKQKAFGRLVVQ